MRSVEEIEREITKTEGDQDEIVRQMMTALEKRDDEGSSRLALRFLDNRFHILELRRALHELQAHS